jgi:hypothetical protein
VDASPSRYRETSILSVSIGELLKWKDAFVYAVEMGLWNVASNIVKPEYVPMLFGTSHPL